VKFDQYTRFACQQWVQAMCESEHFSLDQCSGEEKTAVWDRMASAYDLGIGADPRRVDLALERLEKLGAFGDGALALDIGSGTGAYTLALADKCSAVYALDSSAGMQQVLADKAQKQGKTNIIPLCANWQTVDTTALPSKFDIVLSSLNTGINSDESLVKMNAVSRGFCCYAAPHGRAVHSARPALQKLVFGRALYAAGGNDIIHAFNIIYGLGYQPELTYAPCEWTREQTPEDALDTICRDFGRYKAIDVPLVEALRAYILSQLNEAGLFVQSQRSTIGLMIWNVNSRSD